MRRTPFADEGRIANGDLCGAGDTWHLQMLQKMLSEGTTYNAYSTAIEGLKSPDGADCWLGKLVATGVAPQVAGCKYSVPLTPAQHAICGPVVPRVKYWLGKSLEVGRSTESSLQALNQNATIFFIRLEGGTDQSSAHFSVYFGSTTSTRVTLPPVPNASTILVCQSVGVPFANLSLPRGNNTELSFFAASNITVHMSGGFWELRNANILEAVTRADGTASERWVFPSNVTGGKTHTVVLAVRDRVRYSVGPGPAGSGKGSGESEVP